MARALLLLTAFLGLYHRVITAPAPQNAPGETSDPDVVPLGCRKYLGQCKNTDPRLYCSTPFEDLPPGPAPGIPNPEPFTTWKGLNYTGFHVATPDESFPVEPDYESFLIHDPLTNGPNMVISYAYSGLHIQTGPFVPNFLHFTCVTGLAGETAVASRTPCSLRITAFYGSNAQGETYQGFHESILQLDATDGAIMKGQKWVNCFNVTFELIRDSALPDDTQVVLDGPIYALQAGSAYNYYEGCLP